MKKIQLKKQSNIDEYEMKILHEDKLNHICIFFLNFLNQSPFVSNFKSAIKIFSGQQPVACIKRKYFIVDIQKPSNIEK